MGHLSGAHVRRSGGSLGTDGSVSCVIRRFQPPNPPQSDHLRGLEAARPPLVAPQAPQSPSCAPCGAWSSQLPQGQRQHARIAAGCRTCLLDRRQAQPTGFVFKPWLYLLVPLGWISQESTPVGDGLAGQSAKACRGLMGDGVEAHGRKTRVVWLASQYRQAGRPRNACRSQSLQ